MRESEREILAGNQKRCLRERERERERGGRGKIWMFKLRELESQQRDSFT